MYHPLLEKKIPIESNITALSWQLNSSFESVYVTEFWKTVGIRTIVLL